LPKCGPKGKLHLFVAIDRTSKFAFVELHEKATTKVAAARLAVDIDIASEFRYREAPLPETGLTILVSQSGETADTLAALRYAKAHGQHILSIVNVETSTIARESDTARL
jgi:glucosamine 6-phosphate synthetase-like amidotransferase/phosphosugar isomerase protein